MIDGYTTSDRYPNAQRADTSGLATDSGLARSSVQLHPQLGEGRARRLRRHGEDVHGRIRTIRSSRPTRRRSRTCSPTRARWTRTLREHFRYPGGPVPGADEHVGPLPHHRSAELLRRIERLGGGAGSRTRASPRGAAQRRRRRRRRRGSRFARRRSASTRTTSSGKLPGDEKEGFMILRSFVPVSDDDSKKQLTAFMVAKSDPDHYGKLIVYEMPGDNLPNGPGLVNSVIQQNQTSPDRSHSSTSRDRRSPTATSYWCRSTRRSSTCGPCTCRPKARHRYPSSNR